MDLRYLRYFVALAESLHFGQAAAKLGIVQSALSKGIQVLETELQAKLLDRSKRQVKLTDAGRQLLPDAKDILSRADRAAVRARRSASGDVPWLRIGISCCTDGTAIEAVICRFATEQLAVPIQTRTMSVPMQFAALIDGQLDVGFVRPPITDDRRLACKIITREAFVVAMPKGHRLIAARRLAFSALADEPLVLPPSNSAPTFHNAVLKACEHAGFAPRLAYEADNFQMILRIVAAGRGVALVPAALGKYRSDSVVFRELHPLRETLETAITWRQTDRSQVVADLVRAAISGP